MPLDVQKYWRFYGFCIYREASFQTCQLQWRYGLSLHAQNSFMSYELIKFVKLFSSFCFIVRCDWHRRLNLRTTSRVKIKIRVQTWFYKNVQCRWRSAACFSIYNVMICKIAAFLFRLQSFNVSIGSYEQIVYLSRTHVRWCHGRRIFVIACSFTMTDKIDT